MSFSDGSIDRESAMWRYIDSQTGDAPCADCGHVESEHNEQGDRCEAMILTVLDTEAHCRCGGFER